MMNLKLTLEYPETVLRGAAWRIYFGAYPKS